MRKLVVDQTGVGYWALPCIACIVVAYYLLSEFIFCQCVCMIYDGKRECSQARKALLTV